MIPILLGECSSIWLEHLTVAQDVGGSSPLTHPEFASVAQLDRAPGFEPVGCAFKSRRAQA